MIHPSDNMNSLGSAEKRIGSKQLFWPSWKQRQQYVVNANLTQAPFGKPLALNGNACAVAGRCYMVRCEGATWPETPRQSQPARGTTVLAHATAKAPRPESEAVTCLLAHTTSPPHEQLREHANLRITSNVRAGGWCGREPWLVR